MLSRNAESVDILRAGCGHGCRRLAHGRRRCVSRGSLSEHQDRSAKLSSHATEQLPTRSMVWREFVDDIAIEAVARLKFRLAARFGSEGVAQRHEECAQLSRSFLGEEMYWVSPPPAKGASHRTIRQHERKQTREESAARARRQRRDAHTSIAPYLDLGDELYAAVFLNIGVFALAHSCNRKWSHAQQPPCGRRQQSERRLRRPATRE
jgi:hypothetical protein